MPDRRPIELGKSARRVRVATLVGLRWLAISGQSAAVLITHFGLGFPLPIGPCLAVIGTSGLVNLALRLWCPPAHRLDDDPAALLLGFDILQLSALLFLTGGLDNPFAMLFLAPVMISAASLSPSRTLLLGLLTGVAATFLIMHHDPLPWYPNQSFELPSAYRLGTWTAVVLGSAFTGIYASRVAEESRQLANALAATELVLAREQHLTQLDGLAAAAAHELGTPLATITLVVKELVQSAVAGGEAGRAAIQDDLALVDQEVGRCRMILKRIASLGNESDSPMEEMALSHLVEEVVSPQRDFGVTVTVNRRGDGVEPVCARNPGIIYGLGNLVENAIDHAARSVHIDSMWDASTVTIRIADDGPGFGSDILARFGEPYLRGRNQDRKFKSAEGAGLGLGLFIAKTLLERSGARVETANSAPPSTGAIVTVRWDRGSFERDKKPQASRSEARRQALQSLQSL